MSFGLLPDGSTPVGGLVFGISLAQCVENDRISRGSTGCNSLRSREVSGVEGTAPGPPGRVGSTASFNSLIDAQIRDEEVSTKTIKIITI